MILSPPARGAAIMALAAGLAAFPGTAPAAGECGASYTVQQGDTLAAIAKRCGASVEALVEANPVIVNPGHISIGWELTIPGARASLGPEAEVRPPSRDAAAEAALAAGTYEVQAGDSLAGIATALQIPMRALMAANEGVNPFALRPGQVLRLPDGGPEGTAGADASAGEPDAEAATSAGLEAGADDAESAAPGAFASDDSLGRVTLEGLVQRGAECPVLETPEGDTYSLVSAEYGFAPGEYVEIVGEAIELSFCGEAHATLRVTSMTTIPAPQGG